MAVNQRIAEALKRISFEHREADYLSAFYHLVSKVATRTQNAVVELRQSLSPFLL